MFHDLVCEARCSTGMDGSRFHGDEHLREIRLSLGVGRYLMGVIALSMHR
jgi:hypothetical protein